MVLCGVVNIKVKINKSNCHVHLYFLVVSVVNNLEVAKFKLCYVINVRVQFKNGERVWGSFQLLHQGFNVVHINVCVTKYVNELTAF